MRGRNHGAFDPLQAPQYQLDVKTAEPANSALKESRLAAAVKEPPIWNFKRSAIFSR